MSLHSWEKQLAGLMLHPHTHTQNQDSTLLSLTLKKPLALYKELLFNTVDDTVQNIYPYTYKLLTQGNAQTVFWTDLLDSYRRDYPNLSYKLIGCAEHFPVFLAKQLSLMRSYPFLYDLSQYEWLEMEVSQLPLLINHGFDSLRHLPEDEETLASLALSHALIWTPARMLHLFEYSIPDILDVLKQADYKNIDLCSMASQFRQTTPILIYREEQSDDVRFFRLNGFTALFIEETGQTPLRSFAKSIQKLKCLQPELAQYSDATLYANSFKVLQRCTQNGMFMGLLPLSN